MNLFKKLILLLSTHNISNPEKGEKNLILDLVFEDLKEISNKINNNK